MVLDVERNGQAGRTTTHSGELWAITWMKPVGPLPIINAFGQICQVVGDSGLVASLSLVLRSRPSGAISAWLGASSIEGTGREVALVRRLVAASLPFVGVGDGTERIDAPVGDRGIRFRIVSTERQNRVVSVDSALWQFLATSNDPWQLTVTIAGHGAGGEQQTDVGVSMVGSGDDASLVGSLLAADVLAFNDELTVVPRYVDGAELEELRNEAAAGRAPSSGLVPRLVGVHLLALLGRVRGEWPLVPTAPVAAEEMIEVIEASTPPHALIQGGSGLGKTTLLEHLIARDAWAGNTVLVVCPHGDLARRAATHLTAARVPTRMVDFGEAEPVLWNLMVPDPGVTAEQHASLMVSVLRRLWAANTEDYFGPVWTRLMRALLTVLVADPNGPWPLTRLPELLDLNSTFRARALVRIGDVRLTRVIEAELLPMLRADDPKNVVTWIVSKLDPLIGDSTLRSIIDTPVATFPVDGLVKGESLVVAIPDARLTATASGLLAGILIGRVWSLVKRQRPERPIHIYLDEWQRMAVPAIGELMAEGRKHGLVVRLANQNSAQIPAPLWETATSNSGAVVSFRMGPHDAMRSELLYPRLDPAQLTTLPNHWVAMASGGADVVAPSPAPLRRDGGAALRAGHARSVAQTKRALLETMAKGLAAKIAKPKRRIRKR